MSDLSYRFISLQQSMAAHRLLPNYGTAFAMDERLLAIGIPRWPAGSVQRFIPSFTFHCATFHSQFTQL